MTDKTRLRKNAELKVTSVAAAELLFGDVADTSTHELFNLPADAVIIDAAVIIDEASQGAVTVDFGFAGGAELGNDLAVSSTGLVQGIAGTIVSAEANKILTGTGKNVTVVFSAAPTSGKFRFLVTFIEYTAGNGFFMNYTA